MTIITQPGQSVGRDNDLEELRVDCDRCSKDCHANPHFIGYGCVCLECLMNHFPQDYQEYLNEAELNASDEQCWQDLPPDGF